VIFDVASKRRDRKSESALRDTIASLSHSHSANSQLWVILIFMKDDFERTSAVESCFLHHSHTHTHTYTLEFVTPHETTNLISITKTHYCASSLFIEISRQTRKEPIASTIFTARQLFFEWQLPVFSPFPITSRLLILPHYGESLRTHTRQGLLHRHRTTFLCVSANVRRSPSTTTDRS
jgi:hypothetical protein